MELCLSVITDLRGTGVSRQLDFYYRKLKQGLCGRCGRHPRESEACCEICLAKMRFRIKEQRAKARSFRRKRGATKILSESVLSVS